MVTGILFFVSVFFAPIFASIPPWATGGALVIVGALSKVELVLQLVGLIVGLSVARNLLEINWHYLGDAVPAFLAILIIVGRFRENSCD